MIDTRLSKNISYKEAEVLLDSETLRKLTREISFLVVNVRYRKA